MSEINSDTQSATWLSVIAKALAYLCLQEAERKEPEKFDSVLKKVNFLQALGLSRDDAALAAGSSPNSVRVLQHKRKAKTKNGKGKKNGR